MAFSRKGFYLSAVCLSLLVAVALGHSHAGAPHDDTKVSAVDLDSLSLDQLDEQLLVRLLSVCHEPDHLSSNDPMLTRP